jgi:dienelactone hydrolase
MPGPQGIEDPAMRRQLWLVPSPVPGLLMRAYLFRPRGDGPFPLAIVNHGSDQDSVERSRMPMPEFGAITEWLLARGYAVLLPQRPGHGDTGGRYLEDQGRCSNANFEKSGRATADAIAAAIDFMAQQSFIKPNGIVVVGNSAGGWGALALASRNPPNVRAIVNFSGGRGGRNLGKAGKNCSPGKLVATAGEFGRAARIPTLWLYAENDSYFAPDLSNRMSEAYRTAGGAIEFHLLPAVPGEGHNLIQTATWAPYVETFLSR